MVHPHLSQRTPWPIKFQTHRLLPLKTQRNAMLHFGSDEGLKWQLPTIASSVQRRCKEGLRGNTLVSFLLKYLTVAEILSVCGQIKSDWPSANS